MITVLADTHFGKTEKEEAILEIVQSVRERGGRVVWLGDTYDILYFSEAVKQYSHHINPEDDFITGNHDWGVVDKRTTQIGDIFLTHGDLLDFGYGFGRLQQVVQRKIPGTLLERLMVRLRKWSLADTFTFYNLKYDLTDEEAQGFQSGGLKHVAAYLRLFIRLVKSPENPPLSIHKALPEPVAGSRYLGYMTVDPKEILTRMFVLYPESYNYSTIIIGHLHTPIDTVVKIKGREFRLICLSSWVQDSPPQVARRSDKGIVHVEDVN